MNSFRTKRYFLSSDEKLIAKQTIKGQLVAIVLRDAVQ